MRYQPVFIYFKPIFIGFFGCFFEMCTVYYLRAFALNFYFHLCLNILVVGSFGRVPHCNVEVTGSIPVRSIIETAKVS